MQLFTASNKQRLTQEEKNANNKKWYKDQADLLDSISFSNDHFLSFGGVSDYKRMKVNYDLFNNIINPSEFEYVCKPFGAEGGELPANLVNRDIVSGKIKVLLGMEMGMPFSWKVIATNEDATTRKEQEEFGRIRGFVVNEVMRPIRERNEKQAAEQTKGRKLTPNEEQEIQAQVQEQTKAQTPDEAKRYMVREHQDPAEALMKQILEYLIPKERIPDKFNKGWKHMNLSGREVFHVGIFNGEPGVKVVNSLYFDHDKSPDLDYIEDGEWAVHEMRMSPSEIVALFGRDLDDTEIDRIYNYNLSPTHVSASDFTFDEVRSDSSYTIRVLHCAWKSLMKIGFLTYLDKNGDKQMKLVDEHYKLNEEQGDVKIEWEWIPQAHECYKILNDIYVFARPVPGQYKDLENLYECKLPYYGACVDSLNSPTTAPMDRMKYYQYLYNVIVYRIELLMASDKGKILAVNINAIPKSAGISIDKFLYFMEANKIGFFNPAEEGNRTGNMDVTNMVKEIDMSLASDISKYIEMAEYIERKCGNSIGVTPQMEAQIAAGEAVTNTRQNIQQASHIIRPYFELHNNVKGNVLNALIEKAKVAYSTGRPRKLNYVLDDMSLKMLEIDQELLDSSTYGLFIANSGKAEDAKNAIINLSQAALQNQQADLLDIIKIIRSDNIQEAEELLQVSRQNAAQQQQSLETMKIEAAKEQSKLEEANKDREHQREKELIILKESERRKTEIQKQTILSTGFNENKDADNDGTPDVMEVAKFGVDAEIKTRKQNLDEQEFEFKKKEHQDKMDLEKKKLNKKPTGSK